MKQVNSCAIILAAGSGSRMHSSVPKQFMYVAGSPLLLHSIRAFAKVCDRIVVVTGEDQIQYVRSLIDSELSEVPIAVIAGGNERYLSSYAGIREAEGADYVFIHDAARACVTESVIRRTLDSAEKKGSGIAAVPVKDTIKVADEFFCIKDTPDRTALYTVQTPQTFRTELIRNAYDSMFASGLEIKVTDDASVMEQFSSTNVYLTEGSYENIKVTTPEDVPLAEYILAKKIR